MSMKTLIFILVICGAPVVPQEICTSFVKKENWGYHGNDLGPATIQTTYADCCAQCSKNEKCNAFTWSQKSTKCWLKSSIGNGGRHNSIAMAGRRLDAIVFGGTYQVVHAISGKVLDIRGGRRHNRANVQIFKNTRSTNQLWVIDENDDGTLKLINPKTGKALGVSGGRKSDGTNVQIFTDNGSNAQKWRRKPVGHGIFKLIHASSGKALDVTGAATSDETNVRIWSEHDCTAQKWLFVQYLSEDTTTAETTVMTTTGSTAITMIETKAETTDTITAGTTDTTTAGTIAETTVETTDPTTAEATSKATEDEVPPLRASSIDIHPNARWQQNGLTVAGGNGEGNRINQLSDPLGLYVDDDQTLYVADQSNHRIVEWKSGATSGQVVAGGNGEGSGAHQLYNPFDVIVDIERDSLIICDSSNRRVVRWPRRNGTSGETIISNIYCVGLTMDENGSLYVTDYENDEVRRYRRGESQGTVVAGGNGSGNRLDQLSYPHYVFVDRDHSVYVSEWGIHRVMKWVEGAKQGIVVAGGQGQGNSLTQLSNPQGVVVDQLGTVYVADQQNHRIMRWPKGATQGSVIVGGNGRGGQSNQLNEPIGLSFDRHGNLYVADKGNHRVQKFNMEKS